MFEKKIYLSTINSCEWIINFLKTKKNESGIIPNSFISDSIFDFI